MDPRRTRFCEHRAMFANRSASKTKTPDQAFREVHMKELVAALKLAELTPTGARRVTAREPGVRADICARANRSLR